MAITLDRNIWDSIIIVIVLNSLHDNFKAITTSILECNDRSIKEIQQILAFTKGKLISKQTTGMTGNLAISYRKQSDKNGQNFKKCKALNIKKYFNYEKLSYYKRNCN